MLPFPLHAPDESILSDDLDKKTDASSSSTKLKELEDSLREGFAQYDAPRPPAPTRAASPPHRKVTLNVLVADDNPIALRIAGGLLKKMGYSCHTVNNGQEAAEAHLSSLKNQDNKFDVILMDILMPTWDGFQATQYIRANEGPNSHVPIFAVTGIDDPGLEARCLHSGMDGYIQKPVTHAKLLPKLLRVTDAADSGVHGEEEGGVDHTLLKMKLTALLALQSLQNCSDDNDEAGHSE